MAFELRSMVEEKLLRCKEGNTNIRSKHLCEVAESVGSAHLKQLKWSQASEGVQVETGKIIVADYNKSCSY